MSAITPVFEGVQLDTVVFRGKQAWIARQVGDALGYASRGKRFASSITGKWAPEFREGDDYDVLAGQELRELMSLFDGPAPVPSSTRRTVTVLYEPGLMLALQLTTMPRGRQLRRYLADEVLPQLARDGQYSPTRQVEGDTIVDRDLKPDDHAFHMEALRVESERIALEMRKLQLGAINDAIADCGDTLGKESLTTLRGIAVEIATGREAKFLLPVVDDNWQSPSEMAADFGVSSQRVGLTITALELRGNIDGIARAVMNKAKGHSRNVTTYQYSPAAKQAIREHIVAGGYMPSKVVQLRPEPSRDPSA